MPIFKTGDRVDPACYRPICLLDSLVKVLWRVLLSRMEDWATHNGRAEGIQYGFRRGVGTVEQCLNLSLLLEK